VLHLFLYFIAIASLSSSANLIKLAAAPVDVIGFWRLFIASAILLPFALRSGNLLDHIAKPKKDLVMVFVSAVFFFLHLWTYSYSAQNTRIANCMIIFATNPLFVSLASYFFLKEKITFRLALAYIFAIIGIYNLVSHSISFEQGFLWGDISALISAVLFSGYLVSGKIARLTIENSDYTFIAYIVTAILFGISGSLQGQEFFAYQPITWISIGLIFLFPTILGHVLFSYLMKRMNLNFMSCGKLLEPAMSSGMAYFIFREELTKSGMWAFGFTTAAVLILFVPVGDMSFIKSKLSKKR
jgi:drug/metabolite transporter (DMT)-like permease